MLEYYKTLSGAGGTFGPNGTEANFVVGGDMSLASFYAASSTGSPGEISISDSEVDGTDYLLSSTIRMEDNIFHVLGE